MQVNSHSYYQFNSANKQKRDKTSFGESQVNIFATSDNHGKLEPLPAFYSSIVSHIDETFPKKNEKSTLNIGIFNGDWFMDPGRGGYITDKLKSAGDYQLEFLNKLVGFIQDKVPGFKPLYVPGNHCFDGGDKTLVNYLKNADVTTILTNSSFNQSPVFTFLNQKQRQKLKQYTVLEVPDDKNPKKFNKVLVLGVTIPGVDFYNPKIMDDIHILDRSDKKDSKILSKDLKETYTVLRTVVKKFKKENPDGAVMVMAHTGQRISEMLADNVSNIDVILNGHDHLDTDFIYQNAKGKETRIISLGHDSEKFDAIKLHFNDDGKLDNLHSEPLKFYTKDAPKLDNNPFEPLLDKYFIKDKDPLLYISAPEKVRVLSQKNVRKDNNLLANFVTDAILASINKIEPDVQVFGVASSAFRQDLKVNDWNTNLELRSLLNGQTDSLSKIYIGKVKGRDVANMVIENIADHMKDMDRNTIVQWSGLQINKTELIKLIQSGEAKKISTVQPFIRIKNKDGEYESLDFKKEYKMAIPNYFFLRPKLPTAKNLENHFGPLREKLSKNRKFIKKKVELQQNIESGKKRYSLGNHVKRFRNIFEQYSEPLTMDQLFRKHIESNKYQVAVPDPDDVRIIV